MGLGFCFYLGVGWGPKGSWFYSLLVDLKHKSRNLKYRKRKQTGSPNGQLLKSTKISKIKSLGGGGDLALYLVLKLPMY